MQVVLAGRLVELPRVPEKYERQLLGLSRHQYQSRLGLSRLERDSTNQGCCAEVWLTTRSMTSFIPRSWMAASRRSKSSSVPNTGSTSW